MNAWQAALGRQFGAAIDMLENGIRACPVELWAEEDKEGWYQLWYYAFHCLFFLDYYTSDPDDEFLPPEPFTLAEADPAGVLPPRVYAPDELLRYLEHGRTQCRARIAALTDADAEAPCRFPGRDLTTLELVLYNLRHVQHHAAQLHLLLRQTVGDAPLWVSRSRTP